MLQFWDHMKKISCCRGSRVNRSEQDNSFPLGEHYIAKAELLLYADTVLGDDVGHCLILEGVATI